MIRLALILLIITISSGSLPAMNPLSLEESIAIALENNKELKAQAEGYNAARWSEYNMFGNYLPQASLNAMAVRIDNKTYERASEVFKIPVFGSNNLPTGDYIPFSAGALNGLYRTTYRTNITVQQPLFAGGKIFLGHQISRLATKQAENLVADKENEITHQVTDLYFNILKMQDLKETVGKSILAAEANLHKVREMKEQGMARQTDLLQWQFRLQDYQISRRELENNIEMLLELWNNTLGVPDRSYQPVPLDLESFDREIGEIAALSGEEIEQYLEKNVRALTEHNPRMKNIEVTRKIVGKNYTIAKGNFLPSLNLQFSYEFEDSDRIDFSGEKSWNLAAVLSFPLFRGGANYTNLRKAKAEKRETEYAVSALEDYLVVETRRLSRLLITTALQVQSSKTGLDLARENYRILKNLSEQGMITNSEFLDAEVMLFAGETNVIAAYYDFIITSYELNKYTTFKGVR
jgi:outer membrane protein TolC